MKARVLIYDIETTPLISYNWGIYEQNAIEVVEDWQILCFAYKWLGDKKTHVVSQDDFKGYRPGVNDDTAVVRALHGLFDQADVVIAHNGDKFDQRKAQARMMARGMSPPSPYKQIDTMKVARKYAAHTSNRLNDLGQKFNLGAKVETGGFGLWKGCMAGNQQAWNKMKRYNKQDVVLLEKLYLYLRPWIQNHPAMNVLNGELTSCPKCSEGPLQKRGTRVVNKTTTVQRYQCTHCGGWSQGRVPEKSTALYVN